MISFMMHTILQNYGVVLIARQELQPGLYINTIQKRNNGTKAASNLTTMVINLQQSVMSLQLFQFRTPDFLGLLRISWTGTVRSFEIGMLRSKSEDVGFVP